MAGITLWRICVFDVVCCGEINFVESKEKRPLGEPSGLSIRKDD
jgi:hypothetical protein